MKKTVKEEPEEKKGNPVLVRIAAAAVVLALYLSGILPEGWNLGVLAVGYIVIGYDVIAEAIGNVLRGQMLDENFLMVIATFGAIYVGEYEEALAVMLFYQVGEYFQDKAVEQSRASITGLMDLRPDTANLVTPDGIRVVDPEELEIGDIVMVRPGEKIAVDGIITSGTGLLDTSALTGESVPKDVETGDAILSGCVNLTSVMEYRVEKEYGESTAAKILDMVENASGKKSKAENFITKFARVYTPTVVGIAALIAIVPPLFGQNFSEYLYRACIFLVISCPCALVISVPLSFFGGIGAASKEGILWKGSNYLEAFVNVTAMVFDKTGTLTEGKFAVSKIVTDSDEEEVLRLAAYAEMNTTHPIGVSIRNSYGKDLDAGLVTNYQEQAGYGITCELEGKPLLAGNMRLMKQYG
ncbi:MAG: HAD-IC family P-type ATPase, partial [Erysipelotrichaceae bacterium]|nr:HAD-IC family P-type ATPase [Erysipelotrichaceae bacterium]